MVSVEVVVTDEPPDRGSQVGRHVIRHLVHAPLQRLVVSLLLPMRRGMKRCRKDVPVAKLFDRDALSKALGRDNVVHVVLFKSGGGEKLKADISRLLSLRIDAALTCEVQGIEE